MTYLNQQRFTSNIIHNIWQCFKIFHVYAFNFSTSDSQYWPKHLILWIHRLDSRCDMIWVKMRNDFLSKNAMTNLLQTHVNQQIDIPNYIIGQFSQKVVDPIIETIKISHCIIPCHGIVHWNYTRIRWQIMLSDFRLFIWYF